MYCKCWNPNSNGNRRDTVALKVTPPPLNWSAQNLRLDRGLDITVLNHHLALNAVYPRFASCLLPRDASQWHCSLFLFVFWSVHQ